MALSDVAGNRTCPERLTILPIRRLSVRGESQRTQDDKGESAEEQTAVTPAGAQVGRQPCHQEIQADLRKIGVTIRSRLISHLNNPDHRPEHDEIPKPAGHEIATTPQEKNARRNSDQQDQRQRSERPDIAIRKGI